MRCVMRRTLPLAGMLMLAGWLAGCAAIGFIDVSGLSAYNDTTPRDELRLPGRVYILRGIGHVWSGGMTELADELNRRGTTATAHRHGEWRELADEAIGLYKSAPERWPIVLIGHSNGADNIINMAYRLQEHGVPVALAVGFDPTRFNRPVPANVRRFINLYQSTNLLGGGRVDATAGFRGQLINVDLRNHFEIGHMNMDKSRRLHREVIAKVLQVVAIGEPDPQPMVSIKYLIPASAPIELWDGGIPAVVQPGETLDSIAARYGVPAWAIAQASGMTEGQEFSTAGQEFGAWQKIVIPRHLNTLPAMRLQQTTSSSGPEGYLSSRPALAGAN